MTIEEAMQKIKDEIRMYDEESLESCDWEDCFFTIKHTLNNLQELVKSKLLKDCESCKTNKWIPVSERLPKKHVEVLATTLWNDITIVYRYSENDWFGEEGHINLHTDKIVAWMPLPTPYKAESKIEQTLAYADQDSLMPAT